MLSSFVMGREDGYVFALLYTYSINTIFPYTKHLSKLGLQLFLKDYFHQTVYSCEWQVWQLEGELGLTCDKGLTLDSDPRCWLLCRPHQSIFYGTLLPDERTRWVCLLDWNCIKEIARRKANEPGCHWSENCSVAAWLEQMKGLISFDNTQQWVMTPKPTPSRAFTWFRLQLFFLKHGLICCAASATLGLVCLYCMRSSLLLAVCVCLGKHVLGIGANPSRASRWNVSPLRRCSAAVSGGRVPLPVFVGRFLAKGDNLPIGPRWAEHTTQWRHYLFHHCPGRRHSVHCRRVCACVSMHHVFMSNKVWFLWLRTELQQIYQHYFQLWWYDCRNVL